MVWVVLSSGAPVTISEISFFTFIESSSSFSEDYASKSLKENNKFWKNFTDDENLIASYDISGNANYEFKSYYKDGGTINGEWIQFNNYDRSSNIDADLLGNYIRINSNSDRPKPQTIVLLGSDVNDFDTDDSNAVMINEVVDLSYTNGLGRLKFWGAGYNFRNFFLYIY